MSATKRRSIDAIISEAMAQDRPAFQQDFASGLTTLAMAKGKHIHQLKWRDWQAVLEDCLAADRAVKIVVDDQGIVP